MIMKKSNHLTVAHELLAQINPITYANERNFIGSGTGISPYVSRGVLTLPQVRDYTLKNYTLSQSYTLIFELAWREYWQREWMVRGDEIFADVKRTQSPVESADIPDAIINACTGIDQLDKGIKQLYDTGYIHNHVRMWLSGLICNIAHTKWQLPAYWMYYYLLDGDPASNMLSWQWVAGTFSSKKYLPSQENINTYTRSIQKKSFLDYPYEVLAAQPIPTILLKRKSIELSWLKPASQVLKVDESLPTLLYTSFWLNHEWHSNMQANRILVLEPSWFKRFPVSDTVTKFILSIATEIEGLQVYVGEWAELEPQLKATTTHFVSHPSVSHWRGNAEQYPLLFPDVPLKSYGSFMSFWKQCKKNSTLSQEQN
jgi:deoxyribodipyrimidine photo-lyase